jgi:hypothetical protein
VIPLWNIINVGYLLRLLLGCFYFEGSIINKFSEVQYVFHKMKQFLSTNLLNALIAFP